MPNQQGPGTCDPSRGTTSRSSDLLNAHYTIFQGLDRVMSVQPMLVGLADRWLQPGAADYLDHFLKQPYTGGKVPHLVVLSAREAGSISDLEGSEVFGAVLLHEYQVAGVPLGIMVTEDLAGERNVFAPAAIRSAVALRAAGHMLSGGAHLVAVSLKDGAFVGEPPSPELAGTLKDAAWGTTERRLTRRLPLAESYAATLANMGAHTRRNLRYYRRRVEHELRCEFVAAAEMREEEFVGLNRQCSYPTPDFVSRWRYRSSHSVRGGFFAGLRSGAGEWLSMAGGRRCGETTSIDWQMNQTRFSNLSLSTVMRSYLIEHEIAAGSRTLLFEGGTPHSMHLSFTPDHVVDLVAARDTMRARVLRRYAGTILPARNFLAQTLSRPDLNWRPW